MLKFHAIGDWGGQQVRVGWVESGRRIVPEVEEAIGRAWETALQRPGIKLFDGPMCRLERWGACDASLELVLSLTSYKIFFGTNLSHPEFADGFGQEVMANPVGVSPALETADQFLLLGRRNASLAYYPNRVHPFAGALEPSDGGDPFAAVSRELAEELSLRAEEDLAEVRCSGMVEDQALRQPELLFQARTTLTRAQIESQVHADEHGESVAIPATIDGVEWALKDPLLTPVAVASLLLWGRLRFGEAWFDEKM